MTWRPLEFDDQSVKRVVKQHPGAEGQAAQTMQKCRQPSSPAGDHAVEAMRADRRGSACPTTWCHAAGVPVCSTRSGGAVTDRSGPLRKGLQVVVAGVPVVLASSGHGNDLAFAGAKTIELIHQNVHVDAVRDDLDTLCCWMPTCWKLCSRTRIRRGPRRVKSKKLNRRLRGHLGNRKFKNFLSGGALKDRFSLVRLTASEFLKQLQNRQGYAQAERKCRPMRMKIGATALTEAVQRGEADETPILVEPMSSRISTNRALGAVPGWRARSRKGSARSKSVTRRLSSNTSCMRMKSCSKETTAISASITKRE